MSDHALCPACGYALQRIERQLTVGDFTIELDGICKLRGEVVHLTRMESVILHTIVAAGGDVVKREALENICGHEGSSNSADVLICRVRKAFRAFDPYLNPIETLHGRGWRWRHV